jgi:hypothetical protein
MAKHVSGGFSLRTKVELHGEDPRQAGQYLVPGNRNPISADTRVWPVPEDVDRLIQDSTQDFWNPLGLASNLDALLRACSSRGIQVASLFPVGLTVSQEALDTLVRRVGPGYFDNAPSEDDLLSTGWRFVGFDAVELNGLTSGLKGIGYKEPSWSQLRAQFGGALNEVGLFNDEVTTARFAEARGAEIPSHAPFDVVGVLVHDPIRQ